MHDRRSDLLCDLFGGPVERRQSSIITPAGEYPIIDDVIILLPPDRWPAPLRDRLGAPAGRHADDVVQYSFGAEWTRYREILPEHEAEFRQYFDLIDLQALGDARVCDLGCGNGRWSYFLAPHCRELVLVDFSEAIFVARRNLAHVADRAVFFMGDITALPFRSNFAELGVCLGVLHHLPVPALEAVRIIAQYAPRLLVYLYYALDNRPWHFRIGWRAADAVRRVLSRVRHGRTRMVIARALAWLVYRPLVVLGAALDLFGLGAMVPLYETYRRKSARRIEQDAYDRFFTAIEQRVSRVEILRRLAPHFTSVRVSDAAPYWHFLCSRV